MIAGLLLALTAAACSANPESLGPLAASRSATFAIESIDGPPQSLTRRLATKLSEEAEVRKLAVVSREEEAQYRLRGYLSPHVEHGKTVITWVWDVYGADRRRVLRITGVEQSENNSRDAWAAVDERVLKRIAQTGMDRIQVFLNTSEPAEITGTTPLPPFLTNAANAFPPS